MALAYQDFTPHLLTSPSARRMEWEMLPSVVIRVNQWLATAGLKAFTVETLVLPSSKSAPTNSNAGGVVERWDEDHAWIQVVRVWYEVPPPATPGVLVKETYAHPGVYVQENNDAAPPTTSAGSMDVPPPAN
jgi:hypothetical protein